MQDITDGAKFMDVLKQALDKFEQEEQTTKDEISDIERQIETLRKRIEEFNAKLSTIDEDKHKVIAMIERWADTAEAASLSHKTQSPKAQNQTDSVAPEKTKSTKSSHEAKAEHKTETKTEAEAKSSKHSDVVKSSRVANSKKQSGEPSQAAPEKDTETSQKATKEVKKATLAKEAHKSEESKDDGYQVDLGDEEKEDDTLKSINDALRGLFR